MGLFSFVKSVGEKLGIGDHEPKAQNIKSALDNFNLGTDKVDVKVENGKAVLTGEVKDQETLEKAVLAVGNSLGIESVDTDQLQVANAGAGKEPRFYEVKKGDNLWKISEEVYGKGHGDKNKVIFEANKPMLTSPDKIYPGQLLRIPELDQA
ncbi:peptidoglycan-binding protein LysM [Bartonella sp. LJL80]